MFIITDRAVFAPDEDHISQFKTEYYTDVDLTTLVISEDRTMRPVTTRYSESTRRKRGSFVNGCMPALS